MTIQITKLTGHDRFVSGTDARGVYGEAILCGAQWDHLTQKSSFDTAVEEYDAALEEFLAPLIAASEKLDKAGEQDDLDPLHYIVVSEGSSGVEATPREVIELSTDSVLLRAIEDGLQSRLLWVRDQLVLTAAPVTQPTMPRQAGDAIPEDAPF